MNLQDWQQQVWDCPNMNPTAVAICLAIGSHGNWSNSQTVWPSRQRISSMTGVSRENVGKYMTALEEQGWLKVVKIRKDNVREYELSVPQVVPVLGILAVKPRGPVSNLKKQVVPTNDEVVPVLDKQVVPTDGLGCLELGQELTKNLPEELTNQLTSSTTDKSAVHLEEDVLLEKTTIPTTSLNSIEALVADAPKASFNRRDMIEGYITHTRYLPNVSEELKQQMRDLMLEPLWSPDESRINHRASLAIKEVLDRVQV